MLQYHSGLGQYTFAQMRTRYGALGKPLWDAIMALTPERLAFELNCIKDILIDPARGIKTGFNLHQLDEITYDTLCYVLRNILDNPNLIVTSDDVAITYIRFRELIYLHHAMAQGLVKAVTTDTGTDYYYTIESGMVHEADPASDPIRKIRKFRPRAPKAND